MNDQEAIARIIYDSVGYDQSLTICRLAAGIITSIIQGKVVNSRRDALKEAAGLLDAEVQRHREQNRPHEFCEDYGCSTLEDFATQIRALAETK